MVRCCNNFVKQIAVCGVTDISENFVNIEFESEKDCIYWFESLEKEKLNFYAVFTYVIHKVGAWN